MCVCVCVWRCVDVCVCVDVRSCIFSYFRIREIFLDDGIAD